MEDILDIYKQPYDSQCPQVCIDEMSTQLIGEVRLLSQPSLESLSDMTQNIKEMARQTFSWLLNL